MIETVQSWAEQHARRAKPRLRPIPRDQELMLIEAYVRSGRVTICPSPYIGERVQESPARKSLDDVCRVFGLSSVALLRSSAATRKAALGKYAMMWLMVKRGMTATEIAHALSCSRSSVTHGLQRVDSERKRNGDFAEKLMRLLSGR